MATEQSETMISPEPNPLRGTEPLERRGLVDEYAELAVLAACLTDEDACLEVMDKLKPEDFATVAHGDIWEAIQVCEASGRPIDLVTVADEMKRAGSLARAGGIVKLEDLVTLASRLDNVAEYADIVADRALVRHVAHASREISQVALDPRSSGEDALAFAEREVFKISGRAESSAFVSVQKALPESMAELAKARTSVLVGHPTGLRDLDRLTGGAQSGQLILIAARPGMGKTVMGLSLAANIAETSGDPVVFLSYEMRVHELMTRLLASRLGVNLGELRQGRFPKEMESDLLAHANRLADMPLLFSENPPNTISGVRAALRRLARRGPIGAVVIDYLQLMAGDRPSRDPNRVQEISEISRGLKVLARELGVPIIALSQLNRQLENRPDKRPHLSDLRDSGSLEQDADTVWMLYRDAVYHPDSDPEDAELLIVKQRSGPLGTVHFRMELAHQRITDRPEGYTPQSSFSVPRPRSSGGGGLF